MYKPSFESNLVSVDDHHGRARGAACSVGETRTVAGLRECAAPWSVPVIAHHSLSSFDNVIIVLPNPLLYGI